MTVYFSKHNIFTNISKKRRNLKHTLLKFINRPFCAHASTFLSWTDVSCCHFCLFYSPSSFLRACSSCSWSVAILGREKSALCHYMLLCCSWFQWPRGKNHRFYYYNYIFCCKIVFQARLLHVFKFCLLYINDVFLTVNCISIINLS